MLASGSKDSTVVLTDLRWGRTKTLHTLKHHTAWVLGVAFSPDGTMLASGGHDSTVILTDPQTGKVLHKLRHHAECVTCLGFSPDGTVLASGSLDSTLVLTDPRTGRALHTLKHNVPLCYASGLNCLAFSRDGDVLASGSRGGPVVLLSKPMNFVPSTLVEAAKRTGHLAVAELCSHRRSFAAKVPALPEGKHQSGMQQLAAALDTLPSDFIDADAIAAQIKRDLNVEYDHAVASGAAEVAEAALVLRTHVEAVLCLPLQESVDAVAGAKPMYRSKVDELSALTAKLQDPSWWYSRAVIAPMQDVYANKLLEEVRLADLDALREVAERRLDADLKIYSAIHDKEKLKPEYSELAAEVTKLEADVRARCKRKPRQPGPEPEDTPMTVAQVKAQAADAHAAYREVVLQVAAAAGVAKDGVKIPAIKGAYRMLQKAVRTAKAASGEIAIGDCRSICDVNRALLTADSPAHARKIVAEIVRHPRVQLKWMKDRINHPTDGGWCDVLYLFSIEGTNGHVNEVQVAFKNMISQRTAGASHQAYAHARDAIETIEAAGSEFVKQANADPANLLEEVRRLTQQNRGLSQQVNAMKDEMKAVVESDRAKSEEIERLRREVVALSASGDEDAQ